MPGPLPGNLMIHTQIRQWVNHHPVTSFFVLAYGVSWGLWLPIVLGYNGPLRNTVFVGGIFGPAVAGSIVTWLAGGSVRVWLRHTVRWRVPFRWWVLALTLPALLIGAASTGYALLGYPVDVSLLPGRLSGYVPALLLTALMGGGQEEFGWRGVALPHLEARLGPVAATLVLGVVWALWHLPVIAADRSFQHGLNLSALLPVLLLSLVSIVGYAFFLTWLFNRTHSVVLAMLLHAGFNTANELLVPLSTSAVAGSTYTVLSVTMTLTLVVAAGLLVAATRGRLGFAAAPGIVPDDPQDTGADVPRASLELA